MGHFQEFINIARIGKHGFIGGYSVITKDVLPYSKTVGNRAQCYGLIPSGCGGRDSIHQESIQSEMHSGCLLQSHLNTSQAVEAISKEEP